jgi:hypothetical protein
MNGYKLARLPKKEFSILKSQLSSETYCHKKKNTQCINNSIDKNNNKVCAGCKKVIIPSNGNYVELLENFQKEGGRYSCCYDCNFQWFCINCNIIVDFRGVPFVSCPNSLTRQLNNKTYSEGIYSNLSEIEYECLTQYLGKVKKYRLLSRNYLSLRILLPIYKEFIAYPNKIVEFFKIYKKLVKWCYAKNPQIFMNSNKFLELFNNQLGETGCGFVLVKEEYGNELKIVRL